MIDTEILIIGGGAAGLTAAIELSQDHKVSVISKEKIVDSSTWYAQGGIAAVMGEKDSIEASYPRKALRLAKEGYVIVEFDVSADGDVIDPFVLEGEPAGLFDRAAMKSIRKWIYQPPIYEGVPVQVNDVQVKLSFRVQ